MKNRRTLLYSLIAVVSFVVVIYAAFLLSLISSGSFSSINEAGVFGDSFGVITSLFSGLTFAGLVVTILFQQDSLNVQRDEWSQAKEQFEYQYINLKVQRFENTFFRVLDLFITCRNDMRWSGNSISSEPKMVIGRAAIDIMYSDLKHLYLAKDNVMKNDQITVYDRIYLAEMSAVISSYNKFYELRGGELGQYFRTLYNLLKLIENEGGISDDEKKIYANLVRAQLSRSELLILFYNCLSGYKKMAALVRKYQILKHVESSELIDAHQELWRNFMSANDVSVDKGIN